jgi:succinate-acetate transporter protein
MSSTDVQKVKVVVADPSGLGLFGLAMVTLVASTQKLGWTTGLSFVVPWAIFLGAYAQLMAASLDFKHNNIFGATVFGAYGLFWFSVASCWLIKMGVFGQALMADADVHQLGVAFIGYLIFSLAMTVGSFETNKVLLLDFIFIDLLFVFLAADSFGAPHWVHTLAGWSELMISLISFYGCAAVVLNQHFGKVFLPMGKPCRIFK